MKRKNCDFFLYIHAFFFLWFAAFFLSIFGSGKLAGMLAPGFILFLFVNIPFSVLTIVLKIKQIFSKQFKIPILVLAILNFLVGIAAWTFVIILSQSPKFQASAGILISHLM